MDPAWWWMDCHPSADRWDVRNEWRRNIDQRRRKDCILWTFDKEQAGHGAWLVILIWWFYYYGYFYIYNSRTTADFTITVSAPWQNRNRATLLTVISMDFFGMDCRSGWWLWPLIYYLWSGYSQGDHVAWSERPKKKWSLFSDEVSTQSYFSYSKNTPYPNVTMHYLIQWWRIGFSRYHLPMQHYWKTCFFWL